MIGTLSLDDLDIDHTQIGLKGSPTNVFRSFVPIKEKHTEIDGRAKREREGGYACR